MDVLSRVIVFVLCVHVNLGSNDPSVVIKDGASIAQMGSMLDSPLLRMLGKVFIHTEGLMLKAKEEIFEDLCDLQPCTVWSSWSDCSANAIGSFGMQSRKRKCGIESPFCIQTKPLSSDGMKLVDGRICEGRCRADFTPTTAGFCLKLFNNNTVSKDTADQQCSAAGGFVVNINSKEKSDAVREVLQNGGVQSQTIWIDGRRASLTDPWQFKYDEASNWTNWSSGEPSNSGDQYCRVQENSQREWFDRNCDGPYWFVCEITNA